MSSGNLEQTRSGEIFVAVDVSVNVRSPLCVVMGADDNSVRHTFWRTAVLYGIYVHPMSHISRRLTTLSVLITFQALNGHMQSRRCSRVAGVKICDNKLLHPLFNSLPCKSDSSFY